MNNLTFNSNSPLPDPYVAPHYSSQLNSNKDIINAEKSFPAFKDYKATTKCLNVEHASFYGDQELFQIGTRKSVAQVLSLLKEVKEKNIFGNCSCDEIEHWFENLLMNIGKMRREIASSSDNTHSSFGYGSPRDDTLLTHLQHAYSAYFDKFLAYAEKNSERNKDLFAGKPICNFIDIDQYELIDPDEYEHIGKGPIVLTSLRGSGIGTFIENINSTFFNHDPVFIHTLRSYKDILESENLSPDELKDKIADFHWLFANISPFERGSAWCGEVLTDAAWLLHGYVPTPIEHGKSLDLEAMSSSQEDFRNIYPMGHRV